MAVVVAPRDAFSAEISAPNVRAAVRPTLGPSLQFNKLAVGARNGGVSGPAPNMVAAPTSSAGGRESGRSEARNFAPAGVAGSDQDADGGDQANNGCEVALAAVGAGNNGDHGSSVLLWYPNADGGDDGPDSDGKKNGGGGGG